MINLIKQYEWISITSLIKKTGKSRGEVRKELLDLYARDKIEKSNAMNEITFRVKHDKSHSLDNN